jgi:predicted DNA-binding transcriptional regulator AlpA
MDTIHPTTTSRKASSIEQFCKDHGISRATFYNLKKTGKTPRLMHVGTRVLITDEAAAEWRAAMTVA